MIIKARARRKITWCLKGSSLRNVSQLLTIHTPKVSIHILHADLHAVLYEFLSLLVREFSKQSKLLSLAIISSILVIVMNDSAVLLFGEIRCWSLVGLKG